MGNVHRVSAPADSDMDTWGHCLPCKLGPPSALHTPSVHSNSTSQVGSVRCHSTHKHNTKPARAQSGASLGRGTGRSLASSVFPILSEEWPGTTEPWCSWGPAQNPGLPMGNHLGSADDTAQR
eukprot:1563879-Amphidinium_carterae.2